MIHHVETLDECKKSALHAFTHSTELVLVLSETFEFGDIGKIPIIVGECKNECSGMVFVTIDGNESSLAPCAVCGEILEMDSTIDMIVQGCVVLYSWWGE